MSDPQFNSVSTNSLESVGRRKVMAPKKKYGKQDWREDGDSAHWVAAKRNTKRVTPTDSNSSVKYTGKRKVTRKRVAGK
jgi:hypothetical protein